MSRSWTQPMCEDCWNRRNPTRRASRLADGPLERCAWCDVRTTSGIYVRANPASVPYPKDTREE